MTRTLIGVALALTAAICAAWVAPSPALARAQTPPVAMRVITVAGGLPVAADAAAGGRRSAAAPPVSPQTLDAGRRFTMAAVTCAVPGVHGAVTVRLRTSLDERTWSRWFSVPLELAGEAGGPARAYTEPLWTGASRYVQVRAEAGAGAPAALAHVRVVSLDPALDGASSISGASPDAAASGIVRVAGLPLGTSVSTRAARGAAGLGIVTRKEWGADESLRGARPEYAKVRMIFVHHTASGNDYTQAEAPAVMRAIYAYHTRSLGWSDIGYNFLIDRFGTIYEGRYGGMKRGVIGAQVLGFNRGSAGISMIGNFAADAPPAEALASLEKLLAWKLKIHHLKPTGTARIRCDYGEKFATGARVTFPVVSGHRQANNTECPGNILYPLLPTVRLEAAGKPQPPIVTLAKSAPARFSPNGDESYDSATLSLWLTKTASWTVELRDANGERLGSFSGEGSYDTIEWSGLDPQGRAYADGKYSAVVSASTALGAASPKTVALVIDTVAPAPASADAEPGRFSANGDDWAETAKVTYQPSERCATRVSVLDAGGKVRRRLTEWRDASDAEQTATWNGQVTADGALAPAADGEYSFLVESRDAAGNVSRTTVPVVLDRTVGFLTAAPDVVSPNGDGVNDGATLGFTLTRTAGVKVAVKVAGKAVRTFDLGQLEAGPHAVVWDGFTQTGEAAASGRLTFTVAATSALGTSSAAGRLAVDLERPVLTTPAALSIALGKSFTLSCTAQDAFSDEVELLYAITDATGLVVTSGSRGWVATGTAATWKWKPPAPGVYTLACAATDRGGNRELAPAATQLTVQ